MKVLTLIIVIFIVIISCKKEYYYELDPEFKSYFGSYKDGSWWVLRDTSANNTDSIYVTDYNDKRESYSKRSDVYFEFIDYKLHCGEKVNWTFLHKNAELGVLTENLSCSQLQKVNEETDYFINIPGVCKEDGIYKINEYSGLSIIPNYSINSFSFTDVIKVWNQIDTFYFAKDVGLIQYKLGNNNYLLIDYYVNFK
jgi:hypothetical protein